MTDFPKPSPYLDRPENAPWIVGMARFRCGNLPYPLSRRDIERDTAWALSIYDRLGLQAGTTIHLIGDGAHEVSWWPFENAAMQRRIPWIQAEASAFDAARTDMVLRRFRLQAVIGISEAILDTLLALGRDPQTLLQAPQVVVATPGAARRLAAIGIRCWQLIQLGPIFAFEPPEGGGARYDESEWRVDARDGELMLSTMQDRAAPFAQIGTGLRGRVETVAIAQGHERRIFLE